MTRADFFLNKNREQFFERGLLLFIAMIFIGFIGSRALISIGVACLLVLGIFNFFSANAKIPYSSYVLLIPVFFFLPFLYSFFYSENTGQWLSWLLLKLPFLVLPIAFWLLPPISEKVIAKILKVYVLLMVISSGVFLFRYIQHFQQINESFFSGGRMPVPFSHIRYSLLLVFAFFATIWLYINSYKKWLLFVWAYLFIAIHILSVRSGLLSLYVGLAFTVVYFSFKTRQWKLILGMTLSAIIIGWLSFTFAPSLQNRISYMRYDYSQWQIGKIDGNSDAMRLASLKTGVELFKKNIWFGVGTGDILKESKEMSRQLFPTVVSEESRKMPHNEFLWTLSSTGIIGMIFFLMAWLLPLWLFKSRTTYIGLIFHLVMAVSFMVEYTLEEQVGGTLFMLFSMLFLKRMSAEV